ncbi:MAG: hypothetical protein ACK5II_03090 [Paracoccus sp. (in: a-proteobacteria)]
MNILHQAGDGISVAAYFPPDRQTSLSATHSKIAPVAPKLRMTVRNYLCRPRIAKDSERMPHDQIRHNRILSPDPTIQASTKTPKPGIQIKGLC